MSDLRTPLPATTRALPFNYDPTVISEIATTADVVFTLDETDATDGATVSLAIQQNHNVDFPADFIEIAGSKPPVTGKMNYYILNRVNGTCQFIRYQSMADAVDNANAVVVGNTTLTIGAVTATSTALSWTTATNATQYMVKRYTTADYSDTPVKVYTGPNLSITDTGLTAGTHYYYKVNPGTTAVTGRAAFADVMTSVPSENKIMLFEHTFNDNTGFSGYMPAIEVDESVNKAHFIAPDNYTYELFKSIPGFNPGDQLRITLNVRFVNSPIGKHAHAYFGGVENTFSASDVSNETVILNFTATSNDVSLYFGIAGGNGSGLDFYVRELKIEKILVPVSNKLSGTAFGTVNYAGTPNGTFDKMFDGDLTTFFDAADGSNGYAGLDLGTAQVVNKIKVAPRVNLESRAQGMVLQGSNTSSSDGYTNLFTIPDILTANVLTEYGVNNTTAYRYYRMYSSPNGFCNLSEAEFYTS